jgi:hypothetical protein
VAFVPNCVKIVPCQIVTFLRHLVSNCGIWYQFGVKLWHSCPFLWHSCVIRCQFLQSQADCKLNRFFLSPNGSRSSRRLSRWSPNGRLFYGIWCQIVPTCGIWCQIVAFLRHSLWHSYQIASKLCQLQAESILFEPKRQADCAFTVAFVPNCVKIVPNCNILAPFGVKLWHLVPIRCQIVAFLRHSVPILTITG